MSINIIDNNYITTCIRGLQIQVCTNNHMLPYGHNRVNVGQLKWLLDDELIIIIIIYNKKFIPKLT